MLTRRALLAALTLPALASGAALAHHGWDWTDEADFELTGTIEEIYLGNPHAELKVRAADGLWQVDLAPPIRTRAAGFDEAAAAIGDPVTALGQRSRTPDERRMKAERIVVRGRTFDVYPERLKRS